MAKVTVASAIVLVCASSNAIRFAIWQSPKAEVIANGDRSGAAVGAVRSEHEHLQKQSAGTEQRLSVANQKQEGREVREQNSWQNSANANDNTLYDVSFSPNGQTIASGDGSSTIKLWKLDGTLINTISSDKYLSIEEIRFSPNGQTIASVSYDGILDLWKLDGTLVSTLQSRNTNPIQSISFSPDGQTLVSSENNTIRLWNLSEVVSQP